MATLCQKSSSRYVCKLPTALIRNDLWPWLVLLRVHVSQAPRGVVAEAEMLTRRFTFWHLCGFCSSLEACLVVSMASEEVSHLGQISASNVELMRQRSTKVNDYTFIRT